MNKNAEKSVKLIAIKWGLFSATATLCAFILPVFIWNNINSNLNTSYPKWIIGLFISIVYFSALYHSLYRIRAFCEDLGYKGLKLKLINYFLLFLMLIGTAGIITIFIRLLI